MSFLDYQEGYKSPMRRGGYALGGARQPLSEEHKAKMAQGRAETAALRAQLNAQGMSKEQIRAELHTRKLEKARAKSQGKKPEKVQRMRKVKTVEELYGVRRAFPLPTKRHKKQLFFPEFLDAKNPENPTFNLTDRIKRVPPSMATASMRHKISKILEAQGYGEQMEDMDMMAGGARRRVGRPRKAAAKSTTAPKRRAAPKKRAAPKRSLMHKQLKGGAYEMMPEEYEMMAGGARRRVGRPRKHMMRGGFDWGDVWNIAKKVAPLGLALL
jgi:hypothetical protein